MSHSHEDAHQGAEGQARPHTGGAGCTGRCATGDDPLPGEGKVQSIAQAGLQDSPGPAGGIEEIFLFDEEEQ